MSDTPTPTPSEPGPSTEAPGWRDEYAIGHPKVDQEHRQFFGLVQAYSRGCRQGLDRDAMIDILEEILLFGRFHFRSEENVMRALGFEGLPAHRELHRQLIERLGRMIVGVKLGRYKPAEVEEFLVKWLVRHVGHEDARIMGGDGSRA